MEEKAWLCDVDDIYHLFPSQGQCYGAARLAYLSDNRQKHAERFILPRNNYRLFVVLGKREGIVRPPH